MKKLKFKNMLNTIIFCLFMALLFATLCLCACKDKSENEQEDYPVLGIWHAHNVVKKDNPYNYGGDTVIYDFYFEFAEDGVVKNRGIITLNNRLISDSGWVIANRTWSVDKNVITFSNGKQFVINDDEFDDLYDNMVLRYIKE